MTLHEETYPGPGFKELQNYKTIIPENSSKQIQPK